MGIGRDSVRISFFGCNSLVPDPLVSPFRWCSTIQAYTAMLRLRSISRPEAPLHT